MPQKHETCKFCGHAYEFHATDVSTDKERCWHGAVTGNSCERECKIFVPMEAE